MSLHQYGLVGTYTNETYPTPPCGFFDYTLTSSSLEFSDFQSRICVPNKIVMALTAINCTLVLALWAFGAYLTVREFRLARQWNETKSFCVFYFISTFGAIGFALNDVVGNPYWNSVAWYLCTLGVCSMEATTVVAWAKITLKILDLRKDFRSEARSRDLLRWLERGMRWLLVAICVVLIPLLALRAAWYDFHNPWWYNFLMWIHHLIMLIWLPVFAMTVVVFGIKLASLLNDALEAIDDSDISSSGLKPASAVISVGGGVLGTQQILSQGSTYAQQLRSEAKKKRIKAVIRKVQIVTFLVSFDKMSFCVCYLTYVVYGGLTMYDPRNGMGANFSYWSTNGLVVIWGTALLLGCGWYHLRKDHRSDDAKASERFRTGSISSTSSKGIRGYPLPFNHNRALNDLGNSTVPHEHEANASLVARQQSDRNDSSVFVVPMSPSRSNYQGIDTAFRQEEFGGGGSGSAFNSPSQNREMGRVAASTITDAGDRTVSQPGQRFPPPQPNRQQPNVWWNQEHVVLQQRQQQQQQLQEQQQQQQQHQLQRLYAAESYRA
ncbi:hypothetical protein BJ742DRAFT_501742 [Cladochytrium replicatum]|nr:hypothetical protein BJ742DRAFT_501742 [Cladochytrium replicatum]